jgi:hypothetical protein
MEKRGHPPQTSNFGKGPGKVGVEGNTFFGWQDGQSRRFLFKSPSEAWMVVYELALERGVKFDLLDVRIDHPSEEVRNVWRKESVRRITDWMAAGDSPRVPILDNWQISVDKDSYFATGGYREGGPDRHQRIWDSPSEGWLAIWLDARQRKIPFELLDVIINDPSDTVRGIWQTEGVRRALKWMFATTPPRIPTDPVRDWRQGIGVDERAFFAQGYYGPGGERGHQRIFDSKSDGWLAIYRAARDQGTPFELLEVTQMQEATPEVRKIWQTESMERIRKWLVVHPGHKLKSEDFGSWKTSTDGRIAVDRESFLGTGEFAPEGTHGNSRVFDSPFEAWTALRAYLREKGIRFRLIDLRYKNPSEELMAEMRLEVCDAVLDWSAAHGGKRPEKGDFGSGPGQVGVEWRSFSGQRDDSSRRLYFDSAEQGFDAVNARAEVRGITLDWDDYIK